MIKRCSGTILIFHLLVAFVVFKWAPSHVHINAQHNHGSEQHQHSVEAHAHQPVIFHADSIDFDHPQIDESRVVGLDHDQNLQKDKPLDHPAMLVVYIDYPRPVQTRDVLLPERRNFLPRPLYLHPGQPRAPPWLS